MYKNSQNFLIFQIYKSNHQWLHVLVYHIVESTYIYIYYIL